MAKITAYDTLGVGLYISGGAYSAIFRGSLTVSVQISGPPLTTYFNDSSIKTEMPWALNGYDLSLTNINIYTSLSSTNSSMSLAISVQEFHFSTKVTAGSQVKSAVANLSADFIRGSWSAYDPSKSDFIKGNGFADRIDGAGGDDQIWGFHGSDVLIGAAGNDTLSGGTGNDRLTGAAGNDRFVFDTRLGSNNIDTATDFIKGTDKLILDDDIFAKLGVGTTTGKLISSTNYKVGPAAGDGNDYLIYNPATDKLFYDVDGSGSRAAVQIATVTLAGTAAPTYKDFLLVL